MSDRAQVVECLNRACRINLNPKNLPVIVKTSNGISYIGNASNTGEAAFLGRMCGIGHGKVSRAKYDGDERVFYLLHGA